MEKSRAEEFETVLKKALGLEFPYPDWLGWNERSIHDQGSKRATPAAVLILIGYPQLQVSSQTPPGPSLLFTRRAETVDTHKGQMAFPGGLCEPEDLGAPSTALRETEEEVGIPA